jgi:tRNA wybutosine-synthesizing protein 2
MLALKVARGRAEDLRQELYGLGLLDGSRKFVERDDHVEIPVLGTEGVDLEKWDAVAVDQEEPVRRPDVYVPFDEILRRIELPEDLVGLLPRKWELLGDVLIIKLDDRLKPHGKEVAEVYAQVLGAQTVLEDEGGVMDEYREPRVRVLLGDRTETVHKENGVLFKLDAQEVMFSSGNIDERIRMATICEKDDIVVDMFAGIGYFSIPMAVHSRPAEIYSIEINPTAFGYLCENVRLNEVTEIICPILGDCLEVAPEDLATRVVMGYLSNGEKYLPKAMRVIGEKGIVHYHETCPNELLMERPVSTVNSIAKSEGRTAEILNQRTIKSYAPGVSHIVLDVLVSRAPGQTPPQ